MKKKKQDSKKYNSIPNGKVIVGCLWFLTDLTCLLGSILLPKPEGFGLLGGCVVFLLLTLVLYLKKYSNVLVFSNEKITLKKQSILWSDVYITAYCSGPDFMRNSYDIYIYFDNHYLTEKEIRSYAVKKKGFFIILNYERAEYILFQYPKKLEVLNNSPIDRDGIMSMIAMHNAACI